MKELLQDLRNAIWVLKKERNRGVANEVMDSTMQHGLDVEKMNHFLQKELLKKDEELDAKEKELQAKDEQQAALEAKIKKKKDRCLEIFVCVCVL